MNGIVRDSAIVILGASGDLARRKLIPALADHTASRRIDESCVIVGSGRSDFTDAEFREHVGVASPLADRVFYHRGIDGLKGRLDELGSFGTVIVFFSLPPSVYAETAEALSAEGFGGDTRIIVEKPFGYDYQSARELNQRLKRFFDEEHIYRIDHYLAKEAVQNILVFRFANSLFYPVWNSGYIESIQINASEEIGVGTRGAYFDRSGIIRDMVQNHLIQMLALVTMEAPVSLDPADIRNQKTNILKALEVVRSARGQYEGYHREEKVAPDSPTETFAELEMRIHTFRWEGVPIYIRTGKKLGRKGTEIGLQFKKLPRLLYNVDNDIDPNRILFRIQPSTDIIIDHGAKIPGTDNEIARRQLDFCFTESFGDRPVPDAYGRLLLDALRGDKTLYVSAKETELAWQKIDGVPDAGELFRYPPGAVPPSPLDIEWIDFAGYPPNC